MQNVPHFTYVIENFICQTIYYICEQPFQVPWVPELLSEFPWIPAENSFLNFHGFHGTPGTHANAATAITLKCEMIQLMSLK